MGMPEGPHLDKLREAIAVEGQGHRVLLEGRDPERAFALLREAAGLYGASWELAPPASYGRLIGMLKAVLIAGESGGEDARYAAAAVPPEADSPPAHYVRAIVALVQDDAEGAAAAAAGMRAGSDAFGRAADAVAALAAGDRDAYAAAVAAIVADFETREAHLTGVAIADTALMFERLAARRGLAAAPLSPVLP